MLDYTPLRISVSTVRCWDLSSLVLTGYIDIVTFLLNSNFLNFIFALLV